MHDTDGSLGLMLGERVLLLEDHQIHAGIPDQTLAGHVGGPHAHRRWPEAPTNPALKRAIRLRYRCFDSGSTMAAACRTADS